MASKEVDVTLTRGGWVKVTLHFYGIQSVKMIVNQSLNQLVGYILQWKLNDKIQLVSRQKGATTGEITIKAAVVHFFSSLNSSNDF